MTLEQLKACTLVKDVRCIQEGKEDFLFSPMGATREGIRLMPLTGEFSGKISITYPEEFKYFEPYFIQPGDTFDVMLSEKSLTPVRVKLTEVEVNAGITKFYVLRLGVEKKVFFLSYNQVKTAKNIKFKDTI